MAVRTVYNNSFLFRFYLNQLSCRCERQFTIVRKNSVNSFIKGSFAHIGGNMAACANNSTGNLVLSAVDENQPICHRIAICHMRSTSKKEENIQQVQSIIEQAKENHAKIVFLPECCDYVGESSEQTIELAEPLTGNTVEKYRNLARSHRVWLSCGGVHESILDKNGYKTDKIYNTHLLINDTGEIVGKYRKLHLFDVDTPEFRFRESKVVTKGPKLVPPIQTPFGRIGMQICYDMRFPEVATLLRKQGAEILTYPSAFAVSTGKAHWEIFLRSRAIENQCFVIASAQIGFHNKKRESYGHAMVVGPWGDIIAQCDAKNLDVEIVDLNPSSLYTVRRRMPCFEHRRNDVYLLCAHNIATPQAFSNETFKFSEYLIPNETVFYTSEHSFAFTNIRCVVTGHVLVATKRHVMRLKDLTPNEISDFFQTVCKVQKCTEAVYNTTSSTVTVQDGEDAGQTVKHVHCHVMPRKPGDFEHNDQIYIELNRHDHEITSKRRPVEEMAAEADRYRNYFHKQ